MTNKDYLILNLKFSATKKQQFHHNLEDYQTINSSFNYLREPCRYPATATNKRWRRNQRASEASPERTWYNCRYKHLTLRREAPSSWSTVSANWPPTKLRSRIALTDAYKSCHKRKFRSKIRNHKLTSKKKKKVKLQKVRELTEILSARWDRSERPDSLSLLHQESAPELPFSKKSLTMRAKSCSLSWLSPPPIWPLAQGSPPATSTRQSIFLPSVTLPLVVFRRQKQKPRTSSSAVRSQSLSLLLRPIFFFANP